MSESVIFKAVSEKIALTLKGHHYFGDCPFEGNEGKLTFSVMPEKEIFHCFSCGRGGNVVQFNVMWEKRETIIANELALIASVNNTVNVIRLSTSALYHGLASIENGNIRTLKIEWCAEELGIPQSKIFERVSNIRRARVKA